MSILRREAVCALMEATHGKNQNQERGLKVKFQYPKKAAAAMILVFAMLAGCRSKEDAALDKAKQQAAATGKAQQVVSTDKNGNVTTTTVQPPAPGQTAQAVTTTVTPAPGVAANAPATAPVATGQPVTAGQTDAS